MEDMMENLDKNYLRKLTVSRTATRRRRRRRRSVIY
jgi:hypothetical protein